MDGLKANLKTLQDALKNGDAIASIKNQIHIVQKKLDRAEWDLRTELERLDVAKRILKQTQKFLREFDRDNGDLIKRLRALDDAIDGERKQRARGDSTY